MDNIVIQVENLSKKYAIGHQKQERYLALRDVIANGAKSLGRKLLRPTARQNYDSIEEFWALKGVSFQIKQGEVVGIIGRNGAGKSTLLKILSRITEPTTGRVKINGRVASLLEVGTGFHPELTGRENIYLNGSILGMNKVEIQKKFDEIVAFAEVEKFLDTPVKRYSSGMYVRLAFAVAAHLEPEILVVDEVLAVGDIQFQKKCLGKMGEVATTEKRTVLFVSHNLSSIIQLCTQGILLDTGKLLFNGNIQQTIEQYITLNSSPDIYNGSLSDASLRAPYSNPNSLIKWSNIQIVNSQGKQIKEVAYKEPFDIVCQGQAFDKCENVLVGIAIKSKIKGIIFTSHQAYNGCSRNFNKGLFEFRITIKPNILAPDIYQVEIAVEDSKAVNNSGISRVRDCIPIAMEFSILEVGLNSESVWNYPGRDGIIDYPCKWHLENINQ